MAELARETRLPQSFKSLFWDYDFNRLSWEQDRDLITARILAYGDWEAVSWLRAQIGDQGLRRWIETRQGRGLDARRLRFWELVLGLPHRQVDGWLARWGQGSWRSRVRP